MKRSAVELRDGALLVETSAGRYLLAPCSTCVAPSRCRKLLVLTFAEERWKVFL